MTNEHDQKLFKYIDGRDFFKVDFEIDDNELYEVKEYKD